MRAEQQLLSLITDDIDADGIPELIAFSLVTAEDDLQKFSRHSGEIAIIWKDEKKEPAVVIGFLWNPYSFAIPYIVPPRLNGGRPLIFSLEYCCAASSTRWATPVSGKFTQERATSDDGDWQIYLDPSTSKGAVLIVGKGRSADSITVEPWSF